ncbi:MAG: homocysteine S-methyltransferase family protein, partial [Synergistaceae bacterium]|nr:homocysteine S-methyltransferase family protein [Synergistaceae bacterium]
MQETKNAGRKTPKARLQMERLQKGESLLFLDGGMGTLLAERGWAPPMLPEEMNMERPEVVR